MNRQAWIISGALAFCVFGGACATMSNQKRLDAQQIHTDRVSQFLITQDQKTLIALGQQHHYFLALTPKMKRILQHPARHLMHARFADFDLQRNQHLQGSFVVSISESAYLSLPLDQQQSLKQIGFSNISHQYTANGELTGQRYSALGFHAPSSLQAFNNPYNIRVKYQYDTLGKTVDRLISTPLAVTADGVLVVGVAAAAVIAAPFVGLAQLLK